LPSLFYIICFVFCLFFLMLFILCIYVPLTWWNKWLLIIIGLYFFKLPGQRPYILHRVTFVLYCKHCTQFGLNCSITQPCTVCRPMLTNTPANIDDIVNKHVYTAYLDLRSRLMWSREALIIERKLLFTSSNDFVKDVTRCERFCERVASARSL